MRTDYQTLRVEMHGAHVLIVTLNRPEVANALNTQMGRDLLDLWTGLIAEPAAVRAAILTGAGGRVFCAGGDLKERNGMTKAQWEAQHEIFERAYWTLLDCPVPVIAAVNGPAYAGGCEMTLACDFAYAVPTARFALTEVTLGIMPGAGGTQTLARAVGERRAKEIILSGKPFTAAEAQAWGMVSKVLPAAQLAPEALATAETIARNAPIAVRQAKLAIGRGVNMSLWDGLALEIEAYYRMVPTEDRREGILAFNEKRAADFKGK